MNRKHLNYPPPQVPRTVREVLKDYPELIEDLQDGLTTTHYGSRGPMDFDRAVWLLQDMLDADWGDADNEAEQAEAREDQQAAERAKRKRRTISEARHEVYGDGDLSSYFKTYEKAFR
jgi:hypothetical protein